MHDHCHNHSCDCNDRNPLLDWYKSRRHLPLHKRNHPRPGPIYGAVDYGPGHKCRPDCRPDTKDKKPLLPTVKQTESVKVVELRDAFNNLRYKIVMTSVDVSTDPIFGKLYEIEVVNCFSAPDPLVVVHRPQDDELIRTYDEALEIFQQYVEAYTSLIKAETKDLQDISVYKDTIQYEETCPECCATCKYARVKRTSDDYVYGITGKLECCNPHNILDYDFNREQCGVERQVEPPYYSVPKDVKVIVYPNVQPFGKCSRYEKGTENPYQPTGGTSVADIIDRRTAMIYNDLSVALSSLSSAIEESTDISTMSSNIVTAVGEAIEGQLSSGNIVIDGNSQLADYNNDGTVDDNDVIIGGQGA